MVANSGGKTITVGALSSSSGTAEVTFATRFTAVVVTNTAATGDGNELYVRVDGTAPTVGDAQVDDEYIVNPGESVVVRNGAPLWYQGQGTDNPGTTVQIAGATDTSTTAFTVQGV